MFLLWIIHKLTNVINGIILNWNGSYATSRSIDIIEFSFENVICNKIIQNYNEITQSQTMLMPNILWTESRQTKKNYFSWFYWIMPIDCLQTIVEKKNI